MMCHLIYLKKLVKIPGGSEVSDEDVTKWIVIRQTQGFKFKMMMNLLKVYEKKFLRKKKTLMWRLKREYINFLFYLIR